MKKMETETRTWTKADFMWFLQNTLIPDLHRSGSHATAEDFETAVYFMTVQFDDGEPFFPTERPFTRRLD